MPVVPRLTQNFRCNRRQRSLARDTATKIGTGNKSRWGFAARTNTKEDVLGRIYIAGGENIFFRVCSLDFKATRAAVRDETEMRIQFQI